MRPRRGGRRATGSYSKRNSQHCRIAGASTAEQRNVLLVCPACHFNRHARSRVMPLTMVTEANWEFAREALGDYAEDYLRRYYRA